MTVDAFGSSVMDLAIDPLGLAFATSVMDLAIDFSTNDTSDGSAHPGAFATSQMDLTIDFA